MPLVECYFTRHGHEVLFYAITSPTGSIHDASVALRDFEYLHLEISPRHQEALAPITFTIPRGRFGAGRRFSVALSPAGSAVGYFILALRLMPLAFPIMPSSLSDGNTESRGKRLEQDTDFRFRVSADLYFVDKFDWRRLRRRYWRYFAASWSFRVVGAVPRLPRHFTSPLAAMPGQHGLRHR